MKYIKLLVLITLLISFWSGAASATAINYYVISNDRGYGDWMADVFYNGYFSYKDSATAPNTLCVPDGRWVTPSGTYNIGQLGWTNQYPILTSDSDPSGGCLAAVKSVCLGRYQFGRVYYKNGVSSTIFNGLVGQSPADISSAPNIGYVKVCPSSTITLPVGTVTLITEYDKYARVAQEFYVDGASVGAVTPVQWFKVGGTQTYTAPDREGSNQFYKEAIHYVANTPQSTVTSPVYPSGVVQDEVNYASNERIRFNYTSGNKFIASLNPSTLVQTYETPPLTSDRGTRWIPRTQNSITALPVPDGVGSQWMPTAWTGGSGRISTASGSFAPGTSATVSLGTNYTDTAITWIYTRHYRTTLTPGAMDDWVKAEFEARYVITGSTGTVKAAKQVTSPVTPTPPDYWTPAGSSTITIPEKISRLVNGVEEIWVLNSSALVMPAWATISLNTTTHEYTIRQTNQTSPHEYSIVYNKVTVSVDGVDSADLPWLKVLPGFAPRPLSDIITPSLNDRPILSAPNVIYARDNTYRYVLSGWVGTGSIASSIDPISGMITIVTPTPTITSNSTITWKYKKQLRVKVTTFGENNLLRVMDIAGATSANSTSASLSSVSGLTVGMLVTGYGIPAGTTVVAVNPSTSKVTLSNSATQSYNGGILTFSTVPAAVSADPRACAAADLSFCVADPVALVAVRYYDFDITNPPPSQISKITLTAKQTFTESSNEIRTLAQVIVDGGGGYMTKVQRISGDRNVYDLMNVSTPLSVQWRYDLTRAFPVGKPIEPPQETMVTFNGTDSTVTAAVHGLNNGDIVKFTTIATTTGIVVNTKYFVVNRTVNTFQVSATSGGAPLTLVSDGSGDIQIIDYDKVPTITIDPLLADTPDKAFVLAWDNSDPSKQKYKYFPIHPVSAFTINWPMLTASQNDQAAIRQETGRTIWLDKQTHIAGVPTNLQPAGAINTFHSISYTTNGATVTMGVFNPAEAGTSVIRFTTPPIVDPNNSSNSYVPGTAFIVAESEVLRLPTDWKNVPIGSKITDNNHNDPENKTGYVYYAGGVYDGEGADRAYDRATRTGAIIPVNECNAVPLVVVWFNTQSNIGWPTRYVRYVPYWPTAQQTITIGTGIDLTSLTTPKPRAMVYNQPNAGLSGFNPNEEHALIDKNLLYALRRDLNSIDNYSKPYVLLKYFDDTAQEWKMDVCDVVRPSFSYEIAVGSRINPPFPPSFIPPADNVIKSCSGNTCGRDWYLKDEKGGHWAKGANWKDGDSKLYADKSKIHMQWYYYMRPDFYWPGSNKKEGDVVPFLSPSTVDLKSPPSIPADVVYVTKWPATAPVLPVGDTLTSARDGLPDLYNFASAQVVFDDNVYNGGGPLAKLYAPERYLYVDLAALPGVIKTETGAGGVLTFPDIPFAIQARLFYDPVNKRLGFKGAWISSEGETPWLLPNLMTAAEKETIKGINTGTGDPAYGGWNTAVDALYSLARNPANISYTVGTIYNPFNPARSDTPAAWQAKWGIPLGLRLVDGRVAPASSIVGEKNALSAGMTQGEGFVVVAENNDPALQDAPVKLHVIRISASPAIFQGVIKAIKSKSVFDEKLTLHYTGDFGGEPEKFSFEWYYQAVSGPAPPLPLSGPIPATSEWHKFDDPDNATGAGQTDITIKGSSLLTLSDNWVVARYYYKNAWLSPITKASNPESPATPHDDLNNWTYWSGADTSDTPMLAMGWIKRVIDGLNPLEARVTDFRNNATNTTVSMLSQFGGRYEGPIAFNSDPDYLNSLGLISAYETVLNRGREISIDAGKDYGPTNDALLNITSRLATFYLAIGNEAYADAVDPTIGFSTKSAEYGNMAPSVFAFQNQLDSLLEEELALMRGRDDSVSSTKNAPYYNRLIWNFTQGEGEVAYAQNYNITDQDLSGVINAGDARIMYPQGHGDAWGHYLQSINYYYKLLGHSNFSWAPRVEYVLVAGQPIMVDYLDERKFASIAAARAKTGAEILDATYKKFYTDDPAGQWQGYKDSYADRAWGVDEWARRTGQAAFFDWATANAILPEIATAQDRKKYEYVTDPTDPTKKRKLQKTTVIPAADIQQIDRSKTPELASIASQFHKIQSKMTEVDSGVNPLGLVKGVVPFDIDPAMLDMVGYGVDSKTHFEQIYARATDALQNAMVVYDYANGYTQRLRQNQDTLEEFKKNLIDQERDYRNRLIEIFGYPYGDDIGAGKTYPDGYDGPDIFHYNYVDYTELTGKPIQGIQTYRRYFDFKPSLMTSLGNLEGAASDYDTTTYLVTYDIATDNHWQVKPTAWTTKRRAPGRIQQAMSELIVAEANFNKAVLEFDNMKSGILNAKDNLLKRYGVLAEQIKLRDQTEKVMIGLDVAINTVHTMGIAFKRAASIARDVSGITAEALPKSITAWGGDILAPGRSGAMAVGLAIATATEISGDIADVAEFSMNTVKERVQAGMELKLATSDASYEVWKLVQDMQAMLRELDPKLLETYQLKETLQQAIGNYQAAMAEGLRLMDERTEKRAQASAEVQEYRFQDLGFRIFRNDAIQKYRAQFDLAAKYVYLAATAYDYETNLLGTASGAGRKFLGEIARQRTLGVVSNGIPQAGFPGLADVMARLSQNFAVYKTQLGFNNPQTETTPFSLRTELFRIRSDAASDTDWRNVLKDHRVADLWKVPEFKRYCRPFAPESAGPQPGIVIKFPTTVTYGKNFFGWPLSGGDSAYSTSNFATRVRSVGLWFQDYNSAGLSSTPRVYLVPTGADILRSPTGDGFATREWQVRDQKLPAPFEIGDSDLKNSAFIPVNDSLSDELSAIRRVSDFRAYPYSGEFDPSQATIDSRLIGRSVWNTQWMLIIPGSTLLFNKDVGLNTFINSVSDIKMFFQTYAYSGN